MLLACVRSLGTCPCPQCLIKKDYIKGLRTAVDKQRRAKLRKGDERYRANIETAREIIYKKGYTVNSKAVDRVISLESFTPTRMSTLIIKMSMLLIMLQSALILALDKLGQNFFSLFVVDLMYEFELGIWKAVLTHLIWTLYTQGAETVAEFDCR